MRDIPTLLRQSVSEGLFVGSRRPVARVVVEHPTMRLWNYSLMAAYSFNPGATVPEILAGTNISYKKGHKVSQTYADFLFNHREVDQPLELPNVKSVAWNRSTDSDVADCTIEVWNTKPLGIGQAPRPDELDQPGYYTPTRGGSSFSSRWGQTRNEWFGMLMPDNIIRTFEGYGCNPSVIPEQDPYLVQTGVWMIDSVTITTAGTIEIKCRDLGRILIDQQFWKPVVPQEFYNSEWQNWGTEDRTVAGTKLVVKIDDSSNTPWIGDSKTHSVAGHTLRHAFDGNPNTYWLSIGNDRPSRRFAYEWVQCTVNTKTVVGISLRTKKKGYTAYISVRIGGVWQGSHTINYHEDGIGMNGSDIPYVASTTIATESDVSIKFKTPFAKVDAIRVTLGNLQNFNIGTYHYRAGIRDIQVFASGPITKQVGVDRGPAGSNPGRYSDYTDIVKLLCAWGGFYWPANSRQHLSDGTWQPVTPTPPDPVLGKGAYGRVWGDFEETGTNGPLPLAVSNFDQKPLMDGISYIRDIVGFVFWIDETGAVVWRSPNIYNFGCVRSTFSTNPGYVAGYAHTIDESTILLTLDATLDSKNVREAVFVGPPTQRIGAFAPGWNPNPTGLRRMSGWSDQDFATQGECQLMADLISLAQLVTYRSDRIKIPANPAIQIDDQVRIWERTSAEGFIHYVKGISSSLDMETGEWTYDLDTHWLGMDPKTTWIFNPDQLSPGTRAVIAQRVAAQADVSTYRRAEDLG